MSVLNLSGDEQPECPLCMECLELDDISFYPCSCGYQICRFCWNKIRTEGNGSCPACRSAYSENPADFKPLTAEELAKIKAEKRLKDQAKKQKISENRKHLANVRVVQKNLVFVVGLSPRLADPEVLRKPEYFGKFGKIHKVVINHSTSYAGNQAQGPSASAYVTYYKSEDALRAIQAVNNIYIDGRTLKASLGTTKYCSHFMKNQTCPKHDCMYLHELGDEAASFTKEEMQQGKHTDYERTLHEEMLASLANQEDSETTEQRNEQNNDNGTKDAGWPNLMRNSYSDLPEMSSSRFEQSPRPVPPSSTGLDVESLSSSSVEKQIYDDVRNGTESNGICAYEDEKPDDKSSQSPTEGLQQSWLNEPSSNNHYNDEEDDLGFDPFHETQKALAEMLESESQNEAAAAQAFHESNGLHEQPSSIFPGFNPPPARTKLPPPGFNPLSLPNLQSLHQKLPSDANGFLGGSNLDNFPHLQSNFLQDHFSSSLHNLPPPFPDNFADRPPFAGGSDPRGPAIQSKDWQEGLRALLPNVNVSFGSLPNNCNPGQIDSAAANKLMSTPDRNQRLGWNGLGGNDWTTLDPAIVGGQLSNEARSESPPPWIKANLEQVLTPESVALAAAGNQFNQILPAFASLGLGQPQQQQQQRGGGWTSSNTPPPGFHRSQMPPPGPYYSNEDSEHVLRTFLSKTLSEKQ